MKIKLPNNKLIKVAISQAESYGRAGGTIGALTGGLLSQYLAKKKGYGKWPVFVPGALAGLAIGTAAGRKLAPKRKRRRKQYESLIRGRVR